MTIPEGWTETTFGEIAEFRYGKMPDKDRASLSGLYPIYSGYQNVGYYDEFNSDEDLIIVARGVGGTGDVKISPKKSFVTNLSIIIKLNKNKADKKYLFYKYKINNLRYLDSGSAQSQIVISDLKGLSLYLPPLSEQKEIANILSSFDDKIELLREENKTLEAIAQTIFKEWFVNFNFPDENGNPYKSSGGKMIASELGEIPEGWRIGKIEEITDLVTKGTTPTTIGGSFSEKGINFIKAESILENHDFDQNKISFIDENSNNLLERSKLRENDLLITIAGTIGRFAVITKSLIPANTNQAVAIIRTIKTFNPYYLRCNLSVKSILEKLIGNVVEAVQANLSLTSIKELKLALPSMEMMNLFDENIYPMFMKINCNVTQIQTLTTLRDELLIKLMKGELRAKGGMNEYLD